MFSSCHRQDDVTQARRYSETSAKFFKSGTVKKPQMCAITSGGRSSREVCKNNYSAPSLSAGLEICSVMYTVAQRGSWSLAREVISSLGGGPQILGIQFKSPYRNKCGTLKQFFYYLTYRLRNGSLNLHLFLCQLPVLLSAFSHLKVVCVT